MEIDKKSLYKKWEDHFLTNGKISLNEAMKTAGSDAEYSSDEYVTLNRIYGRFIAELDCKYRLKTEADPRNKRWTVTYLDKNAEPEQNLLTKYEDHEKNVINISPNTISIKRDEVFSLWRNYFITNKKITLKEALSECFKNGHDVSEKLVLGGLYRRFIGQLKYDFNIKREHEPNDRRPIVFRLVEAETKINVKSKINANASEIEKALNKNQIEYLTAREVFVDMLTGKSYANDVERIAGKHFEENSEKANTLVNIIKDYSKELLEAIRAPFSEFNLYVNTSGKIRIKFK